MLCSAAQLRVFRRAAPYPSREEKAVELTDALGRYVTDANGPGLANSSQGRWGGVSTTLVTKVSIHDV